MFTGIVRELGEVVSLDGPRLVVEAPGTAANATVGDSVAVSGACLTVVEASGGRPYGIPVGASVHKLGGRGYVGFAEEVRGDDGAARGDGADAVGKGG